jgi:hypothetical protein
MTSEFIEKYRYKKYEDILEELYERIKKLEEKVSNLEDKNE